MASVALPVSLPYRALYPPLLKAALTLPALSHSQQLDGSVDVLVPAPRAVDDNVLTAGKVWAQDV